MVFKYVVSIFDLIGKRKWVIGSGICEAVVFREVNVLDGKI